MEGEAKENDLRPIYFSAVVINSLHNVQAIDNYGGRDFWSKKVLSKPLKQIMNPRNEYVEEESSKL